MILPSISSSSSSSSCSVVVAANANAQHAHGAAAAAAAAVAAAPPLIRMPNWYFDKKDLKNTPSIRDGLDFETDRRYRKEGARFIMECGTKMGLGHNTMATGVVYFHRFYVFHSFKSFPRYVTACCCLFLAGKVEETPKKCRDIIRMARTMLSDQKFMSFGEDAKEEVMTLERILLQTIKFDLQVEHPYGFLVKYAKCLNQVNQGDQAKLQKMVQMAWNFVNDSLSTTVCLQWEPEIIAVALIHLASKLSKFSVTKWDGQQATHLRWWDMFIADVTMEILEDICHQVLDLYQQPNSTGVDSPPQLPPSKSSPPAKRARVSPVYAKSSPSAGGNNAAMPNSYAGSNVGQAMLAGVGCGIPVIAAHQQQQMPLSNHHQQQQQPGGQLAHHSQQQQQHSHHKPSIDEKLQSMAGMSSLQQRNNNNNHGPPPLLDSMPYGAQHAYAASASSTAYGNMFHAHSQYAPMPPSGGQPPLPPQQQQQQQQYAGGPSSGGGGVYGQPIPTHYQSGSSGGNGSGGGGGSNSGTGSGAGGSQQMAAQNYYQQPPLPGRGSYYQGPP